MSPNLIPLVAWVRPDERPALDDACRQLASALSETSGQTWQCTCTFVDKVEDLCRAEPGAVRVTSSGLELESLAPWSDISGRQKAIASELTARGDPVFILTIVRHTQSESPQADLARRIRIRRLNWLVAELSRTTGLFVIDLDRVIADLGAQRLSTNDQLLGPLVVPVAGRAIAIDIATNGLDAFVSFDLQDAVQARLKQDQVELGLPTDIKPQNLMPMGQGRRKQIVATITDTSQQGHVGWLVRQVLKGQIGLPEAFQKLTQALRRRGLKESLGLLVNAVGRLNNKGA